MYAKLNRTAIRIALCIAALGGVSLTHAGYAQLAAPAGFSQAGSGTFTYAANAANDMTFGRVVHQANGLTSTVAGQPVKMAAAYRLAANAPRYAARAIFLNPYVAAGVGIAAWLATSRVQWDGSKWFEEYDEIAQGTLYASASITGPWYSSFSEACGARNGTVINGRCMRNSTPGDSVEYPIFTKQGQVTYVRQRDVATPERMADLLNPANQVGWPMPDSVPLELPPNTPLPVEQPFINPAPSANPAHRPLFVPTGNPVPNPNYNPNESPSPTNQPYLQPGVRVVPAPTPSTPWQVDLQPVDRPVTSPDPNPEPVPEGQPNDGDKPRDDTPDKSLCEQHPDILACQKPEFDTPEDEIPRETRDVSYQPESLFGGGVCPSNKTMSTHGLQLTVWDWQESCGYITGYFRPVILVLCAVAAFVIVSGGARQS